MYGQGNHGPQFQHDLHKAIPPPQHRPPAPLTPPPPFQQGSSAPAHPLMQQGSLPVRPLVGHQPGRPVYQHAPPSLHAPLQQGPQVHGGMLNTGQSYLLPPPPVHGSAPLPHLYPGAKQSSQYSSHLGTHNLHHIPPPVPPSIGRPHAEILQATPPPRMPPPPPPSQGQTLYRISGLSVPGGVQGLQHFPPPLPPPLSPVTSSYISTATYGSFLHPPPGGSHVSSMALPPPPPLPSSPPPLPPSPPPPASPLPSSGTSSFPILAASDPPSISGSYKLFGLEVNVSDYVDKVSYASHTRDNTTMSDGYISCDGAAGSVMGCFVKDALERESVSLDLLPPPRPTKEKIARSIETLCQLIAETGPDSEDMVRKKEYGNPEFEFLIGGEPGSEAAIAHEYFLWMKNKCNSQIILHKSNKPSESCLRPTEIEPSFHADSLKDAGASHSPADSDMEMEDAITQFDKDQGVHHSFEGSNPECVMIRDELDVKEQLTASESPPVFSLAKKDSSRNVSGSGSSGLAEQAVVSESPSDGNNLEKPPSSATGGVSPSNASASSASTESGKYCGQHSKGGSPFRLLQDYASDDGSDNYEPCLEDVSPVKVSSALTVCEPNLNRDPSYNLDTDVGSKSPCRNERESRLLFPAVLVSSSTTPIEAQDFSLGSQMNVEKTVIRSVATVKTAEQFDGRIKLIHHSASQETPQGQGSALEGGNDNDILGSGHYQKEDGKRASTQLKVDEFGRLVRKGASDSDSDDFSYTRRRGKRGRSWSRSLSPCDRRRRSPWRRRERRSRSRSWSPKKQRSRSKSPINWRVGDYGGEKMRRDKGQIPDCLDFLRGKCHRRASCRFLHHESDKTGGSRRYKSRQHYGEVSPSLNYTEVQEMQPSQDIPVSGFGARRDGNISDRSKVDSRRDDSQSAVSDQDGLFLVTVAEKPERLIEADTQVHETRGVQEEPAEQTSHLLDNDNFHKLVESHQPFLVDRFPSQSVTEAGTVRSPDDTAELVPSSALNTTCQQSLTNLSVTVLQNAVHQPQIVDGCSTSDSSHDQTSTTFPNKVPVDEPHLNIISSTQSPSTKFMGHPFSSDNSSSQLPPPPLSQGTNVPHMIQLPKDYNLMQSTTGLQFQSAPGVSFHAYQAPGPNQQPHCSVPPNSAWTSLPPPPPLPPPVVNHLIVNEATAIPRFPPQLQQNHLPPRNDFTSQTFVRPYQVDLPNPSQVGEFQHRYLSMQEHYRPPLHLEDHRSKHLPIGNLHKPFARPNFIREDFPSSSYAQEQPQPYGLQHSASENVSAHLDLHGNTSSSTPRFSSDIILERNQANQLSHLPDFGGSKISIHYNPYASTFDQPLSSKFSSSAFRQEKDTLSNNKYDAPISLSHLPVHGVGAGSLGSRQMSSPNLARAVQQILPRSGGDQYDPLFDSIEMSPKSFGEYDRVQKWDCTNDADIMLRLSAAHKPLDVEENNKKKKAGAIAASTSLENDEYGETADAEVGAVENGSLSSPIDMETTAAGEIEIDQIKSPGKRKKNKDSRSMKLFKSALADFVKEVLKPSWRQGNMSKEAFKTIVKKTVDKVSGAMKGHQIPKSQAKINQYIDSSQRKLTKLVMGYVDKYVKV